MKKYLIQVTIGPVQDFIASARKLRDLWFGSDLLSELSKTVARTLNEQGAELIFPFIQSKEELECGSSLIVANKILAKIEINTTPAEIIAKVKETWMAHRNMVAERAFEKILEIKKIKINKSLYEKQISDFGEFFAAWVELTDDYKAAKSRLEKLLAGRKNLREFEAPQWDGTGIPKNSLDGMREAVLGEEQEEIRGLLKKNERLDSLGCIKRFYPISGEQKRMHFDDLTDIALIPYLKGVEKNTVLLRYLKEFERELSSDKYRPPKWMSRYRPKYGALTVLPEFLYANKKDIGDTAYAKLKKLTNSKAAGEPNKYACILVGDGDRMGAALTKIENAEGHGIFSKHLNTFAENISTILEKFDGSLIYAGGDDVMAYVPLHTVIECTDAIRKEFSKSMGKIFNQLRIDSVIPTFSIGIAIVHHTEPLDRALNLARKAESIAKSKAGRDALAFVQHKRSGLELTAYGKWDSNDIEGIVTRFTAICDFYESDILPSTLGYQLRRASRDAGDELIFNISEDGKTIIPLNAAASLVLKIFNQKEHSEALKKLLLKQTSIRRLADDLVIARQIAEVRSMSRGDLKNEIQIDI